MERWITIEAERVLYVDRGRDVILCDRGHNGPVTLVVKLSHEPEDMMAEDSMEIARRIARAYDCLSIRRSGIIVAIADAIDAERDRERASLAHGETSGKTEG